MKYKIIATLLVLVTLFSSCALREVERGTDGSPEAPTEAPTSADSETTEDDAPIDYAELYKPLTDEYYKIYSGDIDAENLPDGGYGVMEAVGSANMTGTLPDVGYLIHDLSGDGIPELIIGTVPTGEASQHVGTMIFALYMIEDGEPKFVTGSTYRLSHHVLDDGSLFYQGSGSAAHSAYGVFDLSSDGGELTCRDYWFRFELDGDMYDLRIWHNTVGEMDVSVSELLDMTNDEFSAKRDGFIEREVALPVVHFKDYVAE